MGWLSHQSSNFTINFGSVKSTSMKPVLCLIKIEESFLHRLTLMMSAELSFGNVIDVNDAGDYHDVVVLASLHVSFV